MYRRAFKRTGYRRQAPRRRFGPRLHVPKEPFRWEVCNLVFSTQTAVDDDDQIFTSVVSMAQIGDHFGDDGTSQGRVLNDAVRFLEVGGVVFTYRVNMVQAGATQVATSGTWNTNSFDHRILICSDRLDAVGAPSTIPNWFVPGTPLVATSPTTPISNDIDTQYPTRIHWQDRLQLNPNVNVVSGQSVPVSPTLQTVSNAGRSANLRLRLRLQDQHGLFFHFASRLNNPANITQQYLWACDVIGTMYYRFRF